MDQGAGVLMPQINGFSDNGICVLLRYIAQEFDHALWPVDAHQDNFVAEQDLQGHKYQDLTRATDHLVPHPLQTGFRQAASKAASEPEVVGQLMQGSAVLQMV